MSWLKMFSRVDTEEPASRRGARPSLRSHEYGEDPPEYGVVDKSRSPPAQVKLRGGPKGGRPPPPPQQHQPAGAGGGRPSTGPYGGHHSSAYPGGAGTPPAKQLQQVEPPPGERVDERRMVTQRLNRSLQAERARGVVSAPAPPPLPTGFNHSRETKWAYSLQLSVREGGESAAPTARSGMSAGETPMERPLSSPEMYAKEKRYMERLEHSMRMDRGLDSTKQARDRFGTDAGGARGGGWRRGAQRDGERRGAVCPHIRTARGGATAVVGRRSSFVACASAARAIRARRRRG